MIGRTLSHYKILEELSRGGMGVVYRAIDVKLDREVAERGGVDSVLLGSFVKAGENIRISVRLQEVESGKVLTTEKVEGVGESSIFPMVDDLTRRIKDRFAVPEAADATLDRDLKDVTTSSIEAYRQYAEGINLFERMKQEEAIPFFEKAVELDPEFAMALGKLAALHSNLGHLKEADEYRERAYRHVDRLTARERYYIEGHYHWRNYGEYGRAIDAFKKGVELYPDHGSARHNLAFSYQNLERFDDAITHYQDLVRRAFPFSATYSNLAECYSAKGEFEKGYVVLDEFIQRNPEIAAGHTDLGKHFVRWGRLDEALSAFQMAESLDPEDAWVDEGRWEAFVLKENWDEAEAAAQRIADRSDPFWKWLGAMELANAQLFRGRSSRTLENLAAASDIFQGSGSLGASSLWVTANVLSQTERPAEALELARKAEREGGARRAAWRGLWQSAWANIKLERWEEAERLAEELRIKVDMIPSHNEKRRHVHLAGEMALARGDTSLAIEKLEEAQSMLALRGYPEPSGLDQHVPIWFSLASAHLAAGDEEKAAEWLGRITESTTEHIRWPIRYVRSFYLLGKIQEERGEMEEARKYYRRFVEFWGDGDLDRDRVQEARGKL